MAADQVRGTALSGDPTVVPASAGQSPDSSAASVDHSGTLRTYAEQLPVVFSVPVLAAALRDAADEIDRLRAKLAEYDKYVGEFTSHA